MLRADRRFFSMKHRKDGSEEWGIVSDVIVEEGSTIVTLRSVLQVNRSEEIVLSVTIIDFLHVIGPQSLRATDICLLYDEAWQ